MSSSYIGDYPELKRIVVLWLVVGDSVCTFGATILEVVDRLS